LSRYRIVEICAGAGGQSLGLELAGFEHDLPVEFTDRRACNPLLRRGSASHTCVRRWQSGSCALGGERSEAIYPGAWEAQRDVATTWM
jgi:hypothetical protein